MERHACMRLYLALPVRIDGGNVWVRALPLGGWLIKNECISVQCLVIARERSSSSIPGWKIGCAQQRMHMHACIICVLRLTAGLMSLRVSQDCKEHTQRARLLVRGCVVVRHTCDERVTAETAGALPRLRLPPLQYSCTPHEPNPSE